MTGKENPLPADGAKQTLNRGNIADLHDAVLRTRGLDVSSSVAGADDLSNVVVFTRARAAAASPAPAVIVKPEDHPVRAPNAGAFHDFGLVGCSLVLHAAIFASFLEVPKPMASVGVEAISVEVVLGADTAAGMEITPSESESVASVAVEEMKAEDRPVEQQQETVTEVSETTPEEKQQEQPVEEMAAVRVASIEPVREQPKEEKPVEKPKPPEPKKSAMQMPSAASSASSGIGRGRSDRDSNYRGLVAAQLARHKQYPSAARSHGTQGAGSVMFSIDSSGRVTSASVVQSTGAASLDQELAAMVRRASPFPPPPGGQTMSFSVPVSFRLN